MLARSWRLAGAATCLAAAPLGACAPAPDFEPPPYPQEDVSTLGDDVDPSHLIDDDEFVDVSASQFRIQRYLDRTHYGRRSFLADYRGGACSAGAWCPAADSAASAGSERGINPLLLLAMAQVVGQLLSASTYPRPAARVEFVFGCGCSATGCDPGAGGLANQFSCMATKLREGADGAQPADFVTTDGVAVSNANRATRAIYSVLGEFGRGQGGAWALVRIFQKIRAELDSPG